ncbi:MAG: hypothetical protein IPK80_21660 [Nannocystis sp.]|nr:hypothetical protein [Nannocystis sp.]
MSARALVLALAGGAACSTLAPEPKPVECESDDDCDTALGQVCALDQGKVCYQATLPPRALLGLDIRDNQTIASATTFRAELRGTDAGVERITTRTPSRYRVSVFNRGEDPLFPGVRDQIHLRLRERKYFESEEEGELLTEPLDANIVLTQASRIGQTPYTVGDNATLRFPLLDPMTSEPTDAPLVVAWPHYVAGDIDGARPLLAELRAPSDAADPRGPVHRLVRRDQVSEATAHDITLDVTDACFRRLAGAITVLAKVGEPPDNTDIAGVGVSLRYAEPLPSPATIQPPPALVQCNTDLNCPQPSRCIAGDAPRTCGCVSDSSCPTGQICDTETHRCALDLRDLNASRQTAVDLTGGQGAFNLWVYTHCEGQIDKIREIALIASVDPPIESGLPRLSYRVFQNFSAAIPGGDITPIPLGGKICLPHWQVAKPIAVPLRGAPVRLTGSGDAFNCCSTECLDDPPATAKPTECTPSATVAPSGTFTLPQAEDPEDPSPWEGAGCLPLYVAGQEEPLAARFTRQASSCTADTCELRLSAGPFAAEGPTTYDLRIEPPVGSVFRSQSATIEVHPDTLSTPEIVLMPRVLLRGRVELADEICVPTEEQTCEVKAVVMAERLRIPAEEDQTVLGPYFYALATHSAGEFVLPVNPGVYLLTALPAIGAQGGPARLQVIDLREGSPHVDLRGGIPYADLQDPLLLERGELVTFELDGFSLNTQVIPLDLASWAALVFDGQPLDLNAGPTCYRASGDPVGCQIRRLRPGSTTLRPSQEGFVKYVTR